jgi:hypothetical protein
LRIVGRVVENSNFHLLSFLPPETPPPSPKQLMKEYFKRRNGNCELVKFKVTEAD